MIIYIYLFIFFDIGGLIKWRIVGITFDNGKKKNIAAAENLMLGSWNVNLPLSQH